MAEAFFVFFYNIYPSNLRSLTLVDCVPVTMNIKKRIKHCLPYN